VQIDIYLGAKLQKFYWLLATVTFVIGAWLFLSIKAPAPKKDRAVNSVSIGRNNDLLPMLVSEYDPHPTFVLSEYILEEKYSGRKLLREIIVAGSDVMILHNEPFLAEEEQAFRKRLQLSTSEQEHVHFLNIPHSSPWLRDFAPQPFLTESEHGSRLGFLNFKYRPEDVLDDGLPYLLAMHLQLSVQHVDLRMDGGSFLVAQGHCLISDESAGDPKSSHKNLSSILKQVGCEKVSVYQHSFHHHIDMWLKPLNSHTILVNDFTDAAMQLSRQEFPEILPELGQAKAAFDRIASELEKAYEVARIPTPLPYDDLSRNYANALLVNKTAIMPVYRKDLRNDRPYPDQAILERMEQKAKAAYERAGYKVVMIAADQMIRDGGAFHCAAFGLPALNGNLLSRSEDSSERL
jgi:agmatine/peptidylarginine deiminase